MIIKMLVVGPFASNCFVVASEKTKNGLIIDPGASAKTIIKTVNDLKLVIKLIFINRSKQSFCHKSIIMYSLYL